MEEPLRRYVFGPWTFDPRSGELSAEGRVRRLAPQPALVLQLLLERAGRLVTREFLQEEVWPDTVVEFDKSLNFCIRQVREALDDQASSPIYVETLPRRGYRFKARVTVLEVLEEDGVGSVERGRPWRRAAAPAAVVGAALVGGAFLVGPELASGPETTPSRAREVAEMGGYLLTRGEGDDIERSVTLFREAVALNPGYARAYAGLGSAYLKLSRAEEGKRALRRSLELDPDQWVPHLTLALRALHVEYDRAAATLHFEAALARGPGEVVVQHTYAWYRAARGDMDAAVEHMARALELDPVSPRVNGDVGRLFHLAGRHEEAIAQCRRTLELTPGALRPRECIVHALVEKGAPGEARDEAVAALEAQDAPPTVTSAARAGEPSAGLEAYWRWAAEEVAERAARGEDSHVHAAAAWARLGEADRAFAQLDAALAVHCPVLLQVDRDPAFGPLRRDPRFQALLWRIGSPGAGGDLPTS